MSAGRSTIADRKRMLYITTPAFWRKKRRKGSYFLRICHDGTERPVIACNCAGFFDGACVHVLELAVRVARASRPAHCGRHGAN